MQNEAKASPMWAWFRAHPRTAAVVLVLLLLLGFPLYTVCWALPGRVVLAAMTAIHTLWDGLADECRFVVFWYGAAWRGLRRRN